MKLAGLSSFCLVAGLLVSLPALAADTTPPEKPSVTDDGNYTSSSSNLHARWKSSDSESGIAEYQYLIRQDATSGTIIANWTSVGLATEVTHTGVSLVNGKKYYFGVKAKNGAGLWSSVGYSDGIKVDTTTASAPGRPTEGSSTTDYDYDADGQYTIYWAAASDPESGIAAYEFQEQVSGTDTWTTLTTTTSRSRSVSGRLHNTQYFYRARAKNGAGLWGPWSPGSDGILVDKTAPGVATVRDDGAITSSTSQLHATWTSSDAESGITEYQYLIRQDSTSGTIIVNWTSVGLATDVTRTGLSLLNGRSYFIGVRAKNSAGAWSQVGYSDGITVQPETTPPPPSSYQGFGADTPGGEGQPIYHVTNLNDSGPGSLRDAVSQGNRTVVFDVGGEFSLSGHIYVKGAFITIDGLTAPPPGITLKNYGFHIQGSNGAHDIIVRGIRVRNSSGDGMQVRKGGYNVVIDRVSIHGSGDGNLDITEDSHDVTVSWSIFAEPAGTGKTMLIKYNPTRITLHHNVFVKGVQRNPHVGIDDAGTPATDTTVDMRNNLVWDWGGGHGTKVWYGPWANIVNNFYSNPSGNANDKAQAIIVCTGECDGGNPASASRAYVGGNYSADGINLDAEGTETTPFPAPLVDTNDSITACEQVLANAGVRPLDSIDQQYLSLVSCQ